MEIHLHATRGWNKQFVSDFKELFRACLLFPFKTMNKCSVYVSLHKSSLASAISLFASVECQQENSIKLMVKI